MFDLVHPVNNGSAVFSMIDRNIYINCFGRAGGMRKYHLHLCVCLC